MFSYISDTLFRNHNFKANLLLFGDNDLNGNNDKFKNKNIINYNNYNDKLKIYLNTYGKCNIILESIPPSGLDSNTRGDKFLITQRLFYDFDLALTICIDWLKSKHFKYLFNIDSDGVVKGLGGAAPYHPIIYKNKDEYIRFIPAVVRGIYDNRAYEGIAIKTDKCSLTTMTCTDFFSMASILKNYILNSYMINLQLIKIGLDISKSK